MRKSRIATEFSSANLVNLNPLAGYMLLANRKLSEILDRTISGDSICLITPPLKITIAGVDKTELVRILVTIPILFLYFPAHACAVCRTPIDGGSD